MKSRVEETIARHDKGYNCAQAVVCTYCDLLGIDEETAFKMSEGFGFGMGMTEVCGAVSGMTFIAGLKNSDGNLSAPKTKKDTYTLNRVSLLSNILSSKNIINCRHIFQKCLRKSVLL